MIDLGKVGMEETLLQTPEHERASFGYENREGGLL